MTMSTENLPPEIPDDPHDIIPGKGKSLAQIDQLQRRQEAAIEIQNAYRGYQADSRIRVDV
jgi:hypothetical protein